MKKFVFSLIVIMICFTILPIVTTNAASSTLADLRKDLAALQAKQKANENSKSKTKAEMRAAEKEKTNSLMEIQNNRDAIEKAKVEIENLNIEIAKTEEEIKVLMKEYQISSGENIYLEYIFNSTSYADMVYRYTLTKQIADKSNAKLEAWTEQIAYNEQLKIDLAAREVELAALIVKLDNNLTSMDKELSQYDELSLDIKTEISSIKEWISTLEKLGCGETEDIDACMNIKGAAMFLRPLTKGTITSNYGYRTNPLTGSGTSFHSGIDVGGNAEGTNVYAVAIGVVSKVIIPTSPSCGGKKVYIYHSVAGKKYTSAYLHLLTVNVKVGQEVTANTVIGGVGGGAGTKSWETCSTGAHLHLSLATGWYGTTCSSGCYTSSATFSSRLVDPRGPINFPAKGKSFSGR